MWREPSWWAWLFFLGEWAIRLILLAVVPARRTPTAAKPWLLLIFFEPLLGLVLYLLIGRTQLPRWRRKMIARVPEAFDAATGRLARHPDIQHPQLGTELSQAVRLAFNLCHLPILLGNSA